jgi:hypothetical protein
MEQEPLGHEKAFWVILSPLEHFISGHDTLEDAQAEARRLNQQARAHGRPPTIWPRRAGRAGKRATKEEGRRAVRSLGLYFVGLPVTSPPRDDYWHY